MGNRVVNNCSAEICLNRPDRIFFDGEPIIGHVRLSTEQTMKVNGVYIVLRSKASYNKLVDDVSMRLQRKQHYQHSIHEQKTCVCQGSELPEGQSEFQFEITACKILPPTVHHSRYTNITHQLQLLIDLPKTMRTSRVVTTDITILPRVETVDTCLWFAETSRLREYIDPVDELAAVGAETKRYSGTDELSNVTCSLKLPSNQFGVREIIPYTVELNVNRAAVQKEPLENLQLSVRFIQYVIMYRNMYQKTLSLNSKVIELEKSNDGDEFEVKGCFLLSKSNTAPSYSFENGNIEVSYIVDCTIRSCKQNNNSNNSSNRCDGGKIEIIAPIFIHNDVVALAHPLKH